MRFRIVHETLYQYSSPASESLSELRLWPQDTASQKVHSRELQVTPAAVADAYTDFNGNLVEVISIPFRHQSLHIRMQADITTTSPAAPGAAADLPLAYARRLDRNQRIELYPYRVATRQVPLGGVISKLLYPEFRDSESLRETLLRINQWIFTEFTYQSGSTDISTPLTQVVENRKGVCQDFAHLMLAILRTYGLTARYVSGYIESRDPAASTDSQMIGAEASHAWVEVYLPDGSWWGLDPTNNQQASERHLKIASGRDYDDIAPLRGTYKGATSQKLKVIVSVRRKREA